MPLVFLFLILWLTSCVTITPPEINQAPFCLTYAPVYWSSKDTRKTIEQTDANNRVWKALCGATK